MKIVFLYTTACGFNVQIVAAVDINTIANDVYQHNFPETPLLNRNIEVGKGVFTIFKSNYQ